MNHDIDAVFAEHITVIQATQAQCRSGLLAVAALCGNALKAGRTIFFCGNGGSAADSQHLAAELVGRFVKERHGLAAIALTTDTSILTAVGNDYGYERVFARQVEALVKEGDVVIGLSTSGNSSNVAAAMAAAKERGAHTVVWTGGDGGRLAQECDYALIVPSKVTARIQEAHIMLGHLLCQLIESEATPDAD